MNQLVVLKFSDQARTDEAIRALSALLWMHEVAAWHISSVPKECFRALLIHFVDAPSSTSGIVIPSALSLRTTPVPMMQLQQGFATGEMEIKRQVAQQQF